MNTTSVDFPKPSPVYVIPRADIPAITSVEVDGVMHSLGLVKDFRKVDALAAAIPDQSRISLSWVRLGQDEVLKNHDHPTSSMVIICEGEGELHGDQQCALKAGDIVSIAPGSIHGFRGTGRGFWALSLQFEGRGLYENTEHPRVGFQAASTKNMEILADLITSQKAESERYQQSRLMQLVTSGAINNDAVKNRLLDSLQFWSDYFQRVLYSRVAVTKDPVYKKLALQHLAEEVGHNDILLSSRARRTTEIWDASLEAASSWFYEAMTYLDDRERTILIHFVLEGSSLIFCSEFSKHFPASAYFSLHSIADEDHFQMGVNILSQESHLDNNALQNILRKGWAMITMLCDRMADLAMARE